MNRENKRKQYEKGYYKTHPCQDGFTCKVCGRLMTPENAGTERSLKVKVSVRVAPTVAFGAGVALTRRA